MIENPQQPMDTPKANPVPHRLPFVGMATAALYALFCMLVVAWDHYIGRIVEIHDELARHAGEVGMIPEKLSAFEIINIHITHFLDMHVILIMAGVGIAAYLGYRRAKYIVLPLIGVLDAMFAIYGVVAFFILSLML